MQIESTGHEGLMVLIYPSTFLTSLENQVSSERVAILQGHLVV
jgi:hypothetical protein